MSDTYDNPEDYSMRGPHWAEAMTPETPAPTAKAGAANAGVSGGSPHTHGDTVNLTISNKPSDVRFSHLSTGEAFLMENAPNSGFTAGSLYRKLFNLNAACAIRIEDGHTVKLMTDPVVVRVKITSVTVEQR